MNCENDGGVRVVSVPVDIHDVSGVGAVNVPVWFLRQGSERSAKVRTVVLAFFAFIMCSEVGYHS